MGFINSISPSNLNDYLFQGLLNWLIGLVGFDFEQGVTTIQNRANYNKGWKCYPVILAPGSCLSTDDVKIIITTYINEVDKNIIPEYDRKNNPSKIETIEKHVAKISGKPIEKVKVVFWEAYYATLDGDVRSDMLLRPKTYKENYDKKNVLPDYINSLGNATKDLLGTAGSVLKYLLIAGAVVGGIYVFKNASAIKQSVSGLVGGKK